MNFFRLIRDAAVWLRVNCEALAVEPESWEGVR